ncbi:hypothetical protein I3842_13G175200 [Carya illinoinensis]|uniref:Uncharacterized protein n=1 Tax=Carya illinoinensis TaxID=32201 RepID=A0A922DEU8_CARIL|nr:hypothetical protein I3842_13G175200 [Carya illinoinensis]
MHEHSLTLLACHSFSSSFVAQTRLDRFSMTPFHDHCDQIKLCSSLMQFVLVSSWTFPPEVQHYGMEYCMWFPDRCFKFKEVVLLPRLLSIAQEFCYIQAQLCTNLCINTNSSIIKI